MTCNHCLNTVKNGLQNLDGIETVQVNLSNGKVTVQGMINKKRIQSLISELGFLFIP
ncbi:heavy-metal-associated domain-containing protein [bacterium]|nr:heavy-metal-associated domain-containing protein [bacterium]